jgi:hypothetical protein
MQNNGIIYPLTLQAFKNDLEITIKHDFTHGTATTSFLAAGKFIKSFPNIF